MMASVSFVASRTREVLPRTLRADLYMPLVVLLSLYYVYSIKHWFLITMDYVFFILGMEVFSSLLFFVCMHML